MDREDHRLKEIETSINDIKNDIGELKDLLKIINNHHIN